MRQGQKSNIVKRSYKLQFWVQILEELKHVNKNVNIETIAWLHKTIPLASDLYLLNKLFPLRKLVF